MTTPRIVHFDVENETIVRIPKCMILNHKSIIYLLADYLKIHISINEINSLQEISKKSK